MNCIRLFFMSMLFVVLAYFILGEIFLPRDSQKSNFECKEFDLEWTWIKEDGTREKIEIPGDCDTKRNEIITVEATIPSYVEDNMYICMRSSKQDVDIYVGDELRQNYSTKDTRLFGSTSAVSYLFMEFKEEDAGKTIRLVTVSDSSYSGVFYPIYYGDIMGIWERFFEDYGTELVVAFLTILLAMIAIVGSIALRICYKKKIELEYLGWGVLTTGVWLLANSVFRQLIFPSVSVISDMAFFMIMLMALPFMIYLNEIQEKRYEKAYIVSGVLCAVDFVVCTLLHVTKQEDFADTIIIMAVVSLIGIVTMLVTMCIDIKRKLINKYKMVALGIVGACVAACFQLALYFQRTIPFNGVIMAIGLIFLLVMATISTIKNILDMEREKQSAISASKAKARFLANMSHEIRTPINAILGMNSMILRECKEPHIKEYSLDVQNAGKNMLSLINDILDLSKVESGKLEIIPVDYDLSSLIHDISMMISTKATKKGLKLDIIADEKLPSRLYGDEIRIKQILINILNNAVKYTEEGSVSLKISGISREDNVLLKFVIEDTGIGIREEDIPKLFSEYERIDEERNRNIEGTGLGMNITARLLALMDSELDVESIYGEGSRFSFLLNQRIMNEEPIGNLEERIHKMAKEQNYKVSFVAPKARILVVDDNQINLKVFVNLLKETKINIDIAESGEECLRLITKNKYHIIFLDHMMPDMDGIETLHRMKEMDSLCNESPVVALTANAVLGAREMYINEGFDDYLSKPIVSEKIERMIMEMLPKEFVITTEVELDGDILEVSELPQVDGIDWEFAKLHFEDSQTLIETVKLFYSTIDSEADLLEKFYKGKVISDYRIKVHAMKSSAALIGAIPISGMAKVLEYAAKNRDIDIIDRLHCVFIKEWREYKDKLSMFDDESNVDKQEGSPDALSVYLDIISEGIEEMDIDKLDDTMAVIKEYSYPSYIEELIEKLSTSVINLDGEESKNIIGEIKEKYLV